MTTELQHQSAGELAALVGSGAVSAVELTRSFLDHAERLDALVNALCTINPRALEEAGACDQRIRSGLPARPLEGVPFVAKDNLHTRGLRTTFGSRILADFVPDADSVAVERLRQAGAVLLGKTNTPEFAHDINTTNDLFGTTRNPRDLNRSAGGSSGGTAAAIAAGMAPIGLGTDLGGSVRIPAAFCGIASIRPVPGRVPVYPSDFGWDTLVEHVHGPMARSVSDLGRMLAVLAGPDDRDPGSLPAQDADYRLAASGRVDLKGRRVAYSPDLGGLVPVDPEVERRVSAAVKVLEDLGCLVEEDCFDASDLPEIRAGTRGFGMVARYADYMAQHADDMTPVLRRQVEQGLAIDVRTVTQAERLRTLYWHRVRCFLERYDYIVTPSVGVAAFRLDQPLPDVTGARKTGRYREAFLFSYAFSVTGLPCASVPCGTTSDGLPVGLQIVGRRFCEDRVLEAAAAYSAATSGLNPGPGINLESRAWASATPLTDFP